MRALTTRVWTTLGAFLVLAAVVLATVVAMRQGRPAQPPAGAAQVALANDVGRCSHLGETAKSDSACREAWKRSRARFLGLPVSGGQP